MVKKLKKTEKKTTTSSKPKTTTKSKKKVVSNQSGGQSVLDSASPLGKKFSCYNCGVKFYDLNKPEKLCPKCGSDQNSKPAMKQRISKLSSKYADFEVDSEEVAESEEGFEPPENEENTEESVIEEEEES